MHGFFSREESVIGEGPSRAAVWAVPVCKRAAQGSADEWCQSNKWRINGGMVRFGSVGAAIIVSFVMYSKKYSVVQGMGVCVTLS